MKVKGRKRDIVTDTQGFLLSTVVTVAAENDRKGIKRLLDKLKVADQHIKKYGLIGISGRVFKHEQKDIKLRYRSSLSVDDALLPLHLLLISSTPRIHLTQMIWLYTR